MVSYSVEDGKLVCSFSHRLDSNNCAKWEQGLFEKIEESKMPVVFDLRNVNYIASQFLRICAAIVKKIGRENLTVTGASHAVMKVFRIAGFDRQVRIK